MRFEIKESPEGRRYVELTFGNGATIRNVLSASGNGIIAWLLSSKPRTLQVLLQHRLQSVGEGFGVTAGGFAENGVLIDAPVGTKAFANAEVLRELHEELPGVNTCLPNDATLRRNLQPLTQFVVSTADPNQYHAVSMFALRLKPSEAADLLENEGDGEESGGLYVAELCWDEDILTAEDPKAHIHFSKGEGEKFFWAHELEGFAELARLAEAKRLWDNRI